MLNINGCGGCNKANMSQGCTKMLRHHPEADYRCGLYIDQEENMDV